MTKAKQPKLDDLHLVLLSTAAGRKDGSLIPPAKSIKSDRAELEKAVSDLLSHGLIVETPGAGLGHTWRQGEVGRVGLRITDFGLALIDAGCSAEAAVVDSAPAEEKKTSGARSGSKQALVVELIGRADGATLDELVAATGWLPHTTRAAITGLRKRGHAVTNERRDGMSRYKLAQAG